MVGFLLSFHSEQRLASGADWLCAYYIENAAASRLGKPYNSASGHPTFFANPQQSPAP
jgi:hypothetical protein